MSESRTSKYSQIKIFSRTKAKATYQALCQETGARVIIEKYNKLHFKSSPGEFNKFKADIKTAKKLNNRYCLKIYEFYKTSKHFIVVREKSERGSLLSLMQQKNISCFPEHKAILYFSNIVEIFLHLRVHRTFMRYLDLDSLYLTDQQNGLRIASLGQFKAHKAKKTSQLLNMPWEYILAKCTGSKRKVTPGIELWLLGVILFKMLTGNLPFSTTGVKQLPNHIKSALESKAYLNVGLSTKTKQLIESLLKINPEERLGWEELIYHEVFDEHGIRFRMPNVNNDDEQQTIQRNGEEILEFTKFTKINMDAECNKLHYFIGLLIGLFTLNKEKRAGSSYCRILKGIYERLCYFQMAIFRLGLKSEERETFERNLACLKKKIRKSVGMDIPGAERKEEEGFEKLEEEFHTLKKGYEVEGWALCFEEDDVFKNIKEYFEDPNSVLRLLGRTTKRKKKNGREVLKIF